MKAFLCITFLCLQAVMVPGEPSCEDTFRIPALGNSVGAAIERNYNTALDMAYYEDIDVQLSLAGESMGEGEFRDFGVRT